MHRTEKNFSYKTNHCNPKLNSIKIDKYKLELISFWFIQIPWLHWILYGKDSYIRRTAEIVSKLMIHMINAKRFLSYKFWSDNINIVGWFIIFCMLICETFGEIRIYFVVSLFNCRCEMFFFKSQYFVCLNNYNDCVAEWVDKFYRLI